MRTPQSIKEHMEQVTEDTWNISSDYKYNPNNDPNPKAPDGSSGKGGRYLMSRFPITWSHSAGDRAHASLIDLPDSKFKKDLLIVNVHFVIRNPGNSNQSTTAAKFVNDVIAGKYEPEVRSDVMIMLCGDFNATESQAGRAYEVIADGTPLMNLRPVHLGWNGEGKYCTSGGVKYLGSDHAEITANDYTPLSIHNKTIDFLFWRGDESDLATRNPYLLNTLIMDDQTLVDYGLQRLDVSMTEIYNVSKKGYTSCDHFPYFVDLYDPNFEPTNIPPTLVNPINKTGALVGQFYRARFAEQANDPDGDNNNLYFKKEGGDSWGTVTHDGYIEGIPSLSGQRTFLVSVTDPGNAKSKISTLKVMVAPNPNDPKNYATSEFTLEGTMNGGLSALNVDDNVYQVLEEIHAPNNRSKAYHEWTVDVSNGSIVTFFIEAHHTDIAAEGDYFFVSYSTDGGNTFTTMLNITKTEDDNTVQSYTLPSSLSGPVIIQIRDKDRTLGNTVLDSVFIDQMYILTE